jgi:hypothetical protein
MSGGPFRDTLTPLIDEAQRRLAELRQRRAAIEINYEHARQRLDEKTALAPSPEAPLLEVTNEEEPIALPPHLVPDVRSFPLDRPAIAKAQRKVPRDGGAFLSRIRMLDDRAREAHPGRDSDGRRHYADRSCAAPEPEFFRRRRPGPGER